MEPKFESGALLDTRTEEEKNRDFTFNETVSSVAPVNWVEKSPNEWRSFPIFDQDGSGSCVAQTLKKMLGIYVWLSTGVFVRLSASHIYQRRFNKPQAGMSGTDAFKIAQEGVTLEEFAPSERLSDSQMDGMVVKDFMKRIGEIFKIGNYITITNPTVETIASIIEKTGKGVMVWFYFSDGLSPREWTGVPEIKHPTLNPHGPNVARHSVTAVDYTLHDGKKALVIEDSWGANTAIEGRRIITEDFFNARNFFAAYFMNFAFEEGVSPVKPKHTFNVNLAFGETSDDVKALQTCLRHEGLFPQNIDATGYYGGITADAVLKFQQKYGISPTSANNAGPMTRAKLNQIYS